MDRQQWKQSSNKTSRRRRQGRDVISQQQGESSVLSSGSTERTQHTASVQPLEYPAGQLEQKLPLITRLSAENK